jgi:predicted  nucleic acid-binding Zn-ribbon protein
MLGFWLACIDEDQQVEQGAQHRQELLKAKLTTVKGDLHEVESANSEFADGMRVLQTETAQLQAALARYEQQLPDLEGQKTAAASTRNFKEASRLNGEIKRVQGEQEEAKARLATLQATIAQKESQNADVSKKLSAMQKAVDVAEKAVHTDRFDTLKAYIAKLKARVATGDEFNTAFSQAQLDMATSEANEIAERLGLETVGSVEADTVSLPQIDAVTVDVSNLPAPVPRMTTEEATLVLRSFASQNAELTAQLDTAMAAEEYDLCDELTVKIDQLQQDHAAAQETLGDKAADVTMSTEEAEKVVATYADDLAGLEANLGKAMADEDYDQCDALQVEIDTLKTKKAAADASLSGGPAPVDSTAVAELNTLSVTDVPQFTLPQIPAFESSAPNAQPPEPASMYGDAASGLGASMYDGADAAPSMYEDPVASAGASMYDNAGVGAGASMYGDASADAGASMYADTGGGHGESLYADTGGASMYADTGGASMYDDTGGASMYDDSAATGTGESMYGAGDAGGGGFDFVSGGGDTGENAGEDSGAGGFGFIGGTDATSTAEAEPSGGFGFIGSSNSAAVPATDAAVTSEPDVAEGGGFSFIAGQSADAPAPAGGIYGSEPAASGASMYDDTAAGEGSANIYGEPSLSPYTLACMHRFAT